MNPCRSESNTTKNTFMNQMFSVPVSFAAKTLAAWGVAAACVAAQAVFAAPAPAETPAKPKKLLVVSVTKGFKHDAIPTGEKVLEELGRKTGTFAVDFVRESEGDKEFKEKMTPAHLARYDGVIFNNTSGDLPFPDTEGFLDWLKSGKAFVGIHAAIDTLRAQTPRHPYSEMIGGEFKTHPPGLREVEAVNFDPAHPAVRHLGPRWKVKDEIYIIEKFDRAAVHNLLGLEQHPGPEKTPGYFPVAWCKDYGKGKVFFTSLGHDKKDLWHGEDYQKHLLGGIHWALGLEPGDAKPNYRTTESR